METMKNLASETYSTVNTPTQYAAVEAYKGDYSNYLNNTIKILNAVGQYVYTNLKSNKVLINQPQGGFYLMPEFINVNLKDSSKLCEVILKETGVALLPGSDFGFDKTRMLVRLSFTDFDGKKFMNETQNEQVINDDLIFKFAPRVVEGTKKLKDWGENS